MNDKRFNFFQDHSRRFLEMALNADRQESMANPDGYGKRTGDCGDTVEIFLKIRENKIQAISYHVDGCINTNACCNTVVHLAEGADVNKAWGITPERVIEYLETLPRASRTLCRTGGRRFIPGAFQISRTPSKSMEKRIPDKFVIFTS